MLYGCEIWILNERFEAILGIYMGTKDYMENTDQYETSKESLEFITKSSSNYIFKYRIGKECVQPNSDS
ncbi:hypothetical protein LUQ84_002791 [Hamiltosporidium tvaerminnensis]|nr:hypothetical protein LUQ84_002791 [Hamiltosporidium tvaerminnensis]